MARRRYAVIGTGGIGGLYGAKLANAGFDVTFIGRSDVDVLRSGGLHVSSIDGDIDLPTVTAQRDGSEVGPVDVVLITIKTMGNASLGPLLSELVGPDTVVAAMQNGFGIETSIAQLVPGATVLGVLCFVCTTRVAPGRISHVDYGHVTVGEHSPGGCAMGATPAAQALVGDFTVAGIVAKIRDDLIAARWEKLVWNMPYNGLSVLLDANTDELMADPGLRDLIEEMMEEVVLMARLHGHPVADGFVAKMLANTEKMNPYATSMKLDHEARRPLELESIYDAPLAATASSAGDAPLLRALAAQLHFLDSRDREQ